MRKQLNRLFAFILFLPALSFATANVSGKLSNPSPTDTTVWQNAESHLDLHNCGGNYPVVPGASINSHQVYAISTVDGTWSGTLYRNDEISCNGSFTTWWTLTYWSNGRQIGPSRDFLCSQASCNFDSMTPITTYPAPPAPAQPLTGAQSVSCTFTAATTWTCLNTLNTASVIVDLYDGSGNQLVKGVGAGPTSVVAIVNSVTATFASPTSGTMYVVNAGNWTPSATSPNNIIANPSAPQSITGQALTLTSSAPLTSAGSNTFSGAVTDNSTVTGVGDNLFTWAGQFNASRTGTFTGSQMNSNWNFLQNSCVPLTEYQAFQSAGNYSNDALVVCQKIPSSASEVTTNGLAIYQNNGAALSGGTTANAIYTDCRTTVANSKCEGANFLVGDFGSAGSDLIGTEIDAGATVATTGGAALLIVGAFSAQPADGTYPAVHLHAQGSGAFTEGIVLDSGLVADTRPAIAMNAGVMTTNSATSVGTAKGDIVLCNTCKLKSSSAANNSTYGLIQANSSNVVVVDPNGQTATFGGAVQLSNGGLQATNLLIAKIAPTISSGFGTSPSIAVNNGPAAFNVNVGTGGSATSGVIGVPTATTGWNCYVNNITAAAGHRADNTRQTASTINTVTIENQTTSTGAAVAWTASDIIRLNCFAN